MKKYFFNFQNIFIYNLLCLVKASV